MNPTDNMILFLYPTSTFTRLCFLFVFITNTWLLVTELKLNSIELKSIKNSTFCPYILSDTILSVYHFV